MSTAIVIGGGFFGTNIALYLKQVRGVSHVVLLERGPLLLSRSSFANQARVHRGCHYPRSFTTAFRSATNAPRFEHDFGRAVFTDFTALYAVARRNSKITPKQMERMCREAGIVIEPAPGKLAALFNPALIEAIYRTQEHGFDADVLRAMMLQRLAAAAIDLRTGQEAIEVEQSDSGVEVSVRQADGAMTLVPASFAVSCTYSRLQSLVGGLLGLKHEICEMVLVEPPPELADLGITVMDGPFFSMLPFPARGLHSLSHVRYTPHAAWPERGDIDPYARLDGYHKESRADRMIRDAARYLPAIARVSPKHSLFEVKTVLANNENDDGRPILLRRHGPNGRMFSVLGGKIDNIYDILEWLDNEELPMSSTVPSWTH